MGKREKGKKGKREPFDRAQGPTGKQFQPLPKQFGMAGHCYHAKTDQHWNWCSNDQNTPRCRREVFNFANLGDFLEGKLTRTGKF